MRHLVYYVFIGLGVLTAEIGANPLQNQIHLDFVGAINGLPRIVLPAMGALAVKALLDAQGLLSGPINASGIVVCFQNGLAWRAAAQHFAPH